MNGEGEVPAGPELTAPPPRRGGLLAAARSLVRQLAVAVYLWLGFAFLGRLLPPVPLLGFLAAALLVGVGSWLLARWIEGPLAASGLVGLWFAMLLLVVEVVQTPTMARTAGFWATAAAGGLALVLAGVAGAALARRRRPGRRHASGEPPHRGVSPH